MMSHLQGLPPLPKSLSGFGFVDGHPPHHHHHQQQQQQRQTPPTPVRSSSIRATNQARQSSSSPSYGRDDGSCSRKLLNMDKQLAVLRREMYSLRQQDLSLLSQLWSLNESLQDFRQLLQEGRVLSPPSPSPTASSVDDEEFYMSSTSMGTPSGRGGGKPSRSSAASGSD